MFKRKPLELVESRRRALDIAGSRIEYTLNRKRGRRGVGLKVDSDGLTVNAPATLPMVQVDAMVLQHADWIAKKLHVWAQRTVTPQRWENGATLAYFGGALVLSVVPSGRVHVEKREMELIAGVPSNESAIVQRAVMQWYRREAARLLGQRTLVLASHYGIAPQPKVMISHAVSRWGSCNYQREIRFNWRLIKARHDLIDYVIIHELAHLKHMNHSPAFWKEVERMCPNYKKLADEMEAVDHRLRAF